MRFRRNSKTSEDTDSGNRKYIIEKGRKELLETYPNPLYEGETSDNANKSTYPKTFAEPLTAELLEKHQKLSRAM